MVKMVIELLTKCLCDFGDARNSPGLEVSFSIQYLAPTEYIRTYYRIDKLRRRRYK